MVRRPDNNPARHVETHLEQRIDIQERENVSSERLVEIEAIVSQPEEVENESRTIQEASKIVESVVTESLVEVADTKTEQPVLEMEKKVEESLIKDLRSIVAEKDLEPKVEEKVAESKEEHKEPAAQKVEVKEVIETRVIVAEKTVKKQEEVVRPKVKEPISRRRRMRLQKQQPQ
ncbi:hypothetical protein WMY93_025472 [Mugilogobius chulae]|uniref:Uncharacterized protein n=1 Tax=Mugilogobius chulae TaxID=88201 RepID=A0AAW0NCH6_9GOBI